jgi:hypothetical protein
MKILNQCPRDYIKLMYVFIISFLVHNCLLVIAYSVKTYIITQ